MSDTDNAAFPGFGQLVPGFDFLQNLAKQAADSSANKLPQMPGLGSWVAPTLNVEELDKRIQELKAVQFWLDQNATALKATIQALEVQKMTLATLKGMNFSMSELANAFTLKTPAKTAKFAGLEVPPSAFQVAQAVRKADKPGEVGAADQDESDDPSAQATKVMAGEAEAAAGVVDPMQWWGALTQQFQTIASDAIQDVAKKSSAKTGNTMAGEAAKPATDMAQSLAKTITDSASKTAMDGARAVTSVLRSTQAWPTPKPAKKAAAPAAAKTSLKPKPAAKTKAKAPVRKSAR